MRGGLRGQGIAWALCFAGALSLAMAFAVRAQTVEDGSDAALGRAEAAAVLALVAQRFKDVDPKVSALRRAEGAWVCGSVNVKNRDGLYLGERGFVANLSEAFLGRVPDGPELLNPRAEGFREMERIRALYFAMCLG